MNLELKKAIDQISKDKGLDRDMLVDTLEDAVRTSVIRKYGENIDVEVSYNDDTGEIQVHQFKIVVDDVADPDTEIDIEKARELDPSVQLDDEIGFPLKVTDLGRIAAQSAKQVIIQRMRDAEQELIYEEFKDRVGEICSGIIQRRDKGGWIINLGRTEAILPKEEQIPREHYKRGDRVQALIIEVKKEGRGPQIVISRSHRDYTAALFRREVPEVDDGTVQIMASPAIRAAAPKSPCSPVNATSIPWAPALACAVPASRTSCRNSTANASKFRGSRPQYQCALRAALARYSGYGNRARPRRRPPGPRPVRARARPPWRGNRDRGPRP